MKLSSLYTEQINLDEGLVDQIKQQWTKKKNPVQIAVDQAFDIVVRSQPVMSLDDKDRRAIQTRLNAYKPTLISALGKQQHGLAQSAQEMMAKRAARYVRQFQQLQKDPTAAHQSLGLMRTP